MLIVHQPVSPAVHPSSIIPTIYDHAPQPFFTNITGFYRDATVHPVNLLSPTSNSSFFHSVNLPNLNTSSWNATHAEELRGDFNWNGMSKWNMNLRERHIEGNFSEWNWVKGGVTLSSETESIDYNFYGLHHVRNGTYNLFGQPDGIRIDVRNIPRLYPEHHNTTSQIILVELEKELKSQQDNLLLSDAKPDGERHGFAGIDRQTVRLQHASSSSTSLSRRSLLASPHSKWLYTRTSRTIRPVLGLVSVDHRGTGRDSD